MFGGGVAAQLLNFRTLKVSGARAEGKTRYFNQVKGFPEEARAVIDALRAGGLLIVDDMDSSLHENDDLHDAINRVRKVLVEHPDLVTAELDFSSGVVVATKRGPV